MISFLFHHLPDITVGIWLAVCSRRLSFHALLHCSVIQSVSQRHKLLFCWLLISKIGFLFSFCRQIRAEKKVKFWHRLINWVCMLNKWRGNPPTLPVFHIFSAGKFSQVQTPHLYCHWEDLRIISSTHGDISPLCVFKLVGIHHITENCLERQWIRHVSPYLRKTPFISRVQSLRIFLWKLGCWQMTRTELITSCSWAVVCWVFFCFALIRYIFMLEHFSDVHSILSILYIN